MKVEKPLTDLWIDIRLTEEEMDFLWQIISEENKTDYKHSLAGNISKSEKLVDKDNWFYETVLKKLTERMFYQDWNNYYKFHIEKETPLPIFEMKTAWVNYQKQHEFNPMHHHDGLYSFVVFMKIPTHWKEQHALPISANTTAPLASDFAFVWSKKNSEECIAINIPLSPEDEGRILLFPSTLQHMVYPFYECEEERVTISGNINFSSLKDTSKGQETISLSGSVYEDKVKMLEMMENSVKMMKEELEMMKK